MPDEFPYDVFLSHSAQDKAVVRPLVERLLADGVLNKSPRSTFIAQSPPGTGDVNTSSEPQAVNSLPVGAANYAATPFATQRNFLSFKIGLR